MTQLYATYKKLTVDLRARQKQKNRENESGIRFFSQVTKKIADDTNTKQNALGQTLQK